MFQPDFTLSVGSNLVGLIGTSNDTTTNDKSLRLSGVNGTGPWTLLNPDNTDGWASSATTYYINGVAYSGAGSLSTGWNILGGTRTNTTTGAFASPFSYFLGTEGYNNEARDFRGNIAAVAFYNRSLSAAEQLQNYNYFASRYIGTSSTKVPPVRYTKTGNVYVTGELNESDTIGVSITYNDNQISTSTAATNPVNLSYANIRIGQPSSNRIVAMFFAGGLNTPGIIATVTINGVTATKAVAAEAATNARYDEIWYATGVNGTEANVTITTAGAFSSNGYISTASIYNATITTPVATSTFSSLTNTNPNTSVGIAVGANSVLFAGYSSGARTNTGNVITWGSVIKQSEVGTTAVSTDAIGANIAPTTVTVSVSDTASTVNRPGLVVATWK